MIAARARTIGVVTNMHRAAMRRISTSLLAEAFERMQLGESEWSVCIDLGVKTDSFEGIVMSALEEALWERGYFRP